MHGVFTDLRKVISQISIIVINSLSTINYLTEALNGKLLKLCAFKPFTECGFVIWIAAECAMESHKKKEDLAMAASSFFYRKVECIKYKS